MEGRAGRSCSRALAAPDVEATAVDPGIQRFAPFAPRAEEISDRAFHSRPKMEVVRPASAPCQRFDGVDDQMGAPIRDMHTRRRRARITSYDLFDQVLPELRTVRRSIRRRLSFRPPPAPSRSRQVPRHERTARSTIACERVPQDGSFATDHPAGRVQKADQMRAWQDVGAPRVRRVVVPCGRGPLQRFPQSRARPPRAGSAELITIERIDPEHAPTRMRRRSVHPAALAGLASTTSRRPRPGEREGALPVDCCRPATSALWCRQQDGVERRLLRGWERRQLQVRDRPVAGPRSRAAWSLRLRDPRK